MSAFLCSDKHINTIASYAVSDHDCYIKSRVDTIRANATKEDAERFDRMHDLELIGTILYEQNDKSVCYRYKHRGECEHGSYNAKRFPVPENLCVIIKACDCLAYQSNETPDWESTEAHELLRRIREKAIRSLPGYESAPWCIED